jgi:hypothetical protein
MINGIVLSIFDMLIPIFILSNFFKDNIDGSKKKFKGLKYNNRRQEVESWI